MTAISANGLCKSYATNRRALDDVSFSVDHGSVFALLGPNGAGKSTTVKILTTLTEPSAGSATVAGFDVVRQALRVRASIGYAAQRPVADLWATGRENLLLHARLSGVSRQVLRARVEEVIAMYGLAAVARNLVRTYSGGTQRRLEIAMAVISNPGILFLDEPTAGLDPEVRTTLWRDVAQLVRSVGTTVFLTTHYLEEADQLADRVAILDRGRIVTIGTPEQLKLDLASDIVEIDLVPTARADEVCACLTRIGAVHHVEADGHSLQVTVTCGPAAIPRLFDGLSDRHRAMVASVRLRRPTLGDVYLRHTGREQDSKSTEEGSRR